MKVNIDTGFLEFEVRGSGVPLLFIHGYPLSRQIWASQLEGLSDLARMIAVDLRGHGNSYPFDGPYPMDLLADDCKLVLDELKIHQPAIVCGLSMGGYVTFALYQKYPQIFSGIILTSTRPGPDSPEGKANRQASIKNALERGSVFIADGMLQKIVSSYTLSTNPELVGKIRAIMAKTSVQGVVGALQGMMERPDSTPMLPEIRCPVLVIHGIDDQLIPLEEAERIHQLIPNSKLVKIPQAGHLPCLEQPETFNQAVRDFINELSHA